eukprot:gene4396-5145_t
MMSISFSAAFLIYGFLVGRKQNNSFQFYSCAIILGLSFLGNGINVFLVSFIIPIITTEQLVIVTAIDNLIDALISAEIIYLVYIDTKSKIQARMKDSESALSANQNNNNITPCLSQQVTQVKELIELSFHKGDILEEFGIKPPRGILLYGPPGTGKTLLARIVSKEVGSSLFTINGADILDKYYGMTEKTLQGIFKEAAQKSPSIIFIDELDALCPKRDDNSTEVEKRVVGNGALRRPGRFDREIEIGIPNAQSREEILRIFLKRMPHVLCEKDIASIASKTHGFVGADIESLCKEAALKCFHRMTSSTGNGALPDPKATLDIAIALEDINMALLEVRPSSMREVVVEIPKVHWTDIGGQNDIKDKLREAIEWPLKHPEAFQRMGIKPPKGILLYGPPGCSKTLMAKALATESGLNFLAVKGPELLSKWVGESERAVRDIFKKARQNAPSILFFDEIDGLAITRSGEGSGAVERVVSQLLTEMDGIQPLTNVTIVAATNRPDIIDKAILRAGRIDLPHDSDINVDRLAEISDGYSGAEVTSICKEASICAMKEDINAERVSMSHFEKAMGQVKKGITSDMLAFYKNYQEQSNLQTL